MGLVKLEILKAEQRDLAEILNLQRRAYQSEAALVNDYTIPPLTQTLPEIQADFQNGIILKAVKNNKIIGSVRGHVSDNTLYIGRLMVDPGFWNQGIGTRLIGAVEKTQPRLRYELFTSAGSKKNLELYLKNGYKEFKREVVNESLTFVYLEKRFENSNTYMTLGLSAGVSVGLIFGMLFDNTGLGISIGMCLGLGIGSMIDYYKNKEKQ